ncbi:putative glycerate kinase [Paratrimastix pyriformis]|uniref:Glycerate kinase n=1 Tax=Paratrimastix pyriformis TaxID=342808 RepID=A0ABQ8UHR5_9EUKA|nr:putative glycerate kinase [Paratrimastix pyriformis]
MAEEQNNTIFGKIIRKEIPATIVYEDEQCLAFRDIHPVAATHIILVPKQHIPRMAAVEERHAAVMGHLMVAANKIAKQEHLDGYRLVVNDGPLGGQGTLTSESAAHAALAGLRHHITIAHQDIVSMSDGGEGFLASLRSMDLEMHQLTVVGPRGAPVRAQFGVARKDPSVAVIESSAAMGLALLPPEGRDPWETTSYGLGQLMRAAYDLGARELLVGVGGSATTDGGLGALQALGLQIALAPPPPGQAAPDGPPGAEAEAEGQGWRFAGKHLGRVARFALPPQGLLAGCRVRVCVDVQNPLLGPTGAVRVFGPQKGARGPVLEALEAGMAHAAALMATQGLAPCPELAAIPGTGAAGGIPAGFRAFLGAHFQPGVAFIGDAVGLEERIARADLVLTGGRLAAGEGCYDDQTGYGKACSHVEALCRRHGRPLLVICGRYAASGPRPPTCPPPVDLVSRFGEGPAMADPARCTEELLRESWPALAAAIGFPRPRPVLGCLAPALAPVEGR